MLRRSFLQLLVAAIATPVVTRLDAFVPSPARPVLALEMTDPCWLLETRASQRIYNAAWSRWDGTLTPTPRGTKWTFPTHPDVRS